MALGLGIGLTKLTTVGGAGPVNTVAPVVTGVTERGEVLSCTTGTWTGSGTITYTYQWRRNGANITGATSSTYTLVAADDDANINCVVTATDNEGSSSRSSNVVGPVLGDPLNLTLPAITGTATVRETLTVSNGTWQGVATITFAYQWRKNGVNISGATNSTYTLLDADYNSNIDCIVTATNSLGSQPATAPQTAAIAGLAPIVDTAPVISGSTSLGSTLTRTSQGVYDAVPAATVTGQWRRNGTPIPGETGTTYDITLADSGADIDYLETAVNVEGSITSDSNDITAQTFTAPVNTVAPSITGDDPATIGDVLTRVQGTWSGNPTPTLAGEWYRNNVGTGETGSTYTITAADDNSFIFYRETATNAIGSASEDSAAVTVEDFTVPAITGSPTIAGTEEVGETLTATAASVTGNPTPVRTWQWQRSADGSTGWADISGATSSTYVLDAADETNYVRVKQIETNALGADEAVSAATGEIQAGGATGILDSYTGAAFAFAPDVLIYGDHSVEDTAVGSETEVNSPNPGDNPAAPYTVRVRRSTTPSAVRSFTYTEVSDGTLTTWVGTGNDGFVEAGFDQSTNGNHAIQSTAANQPKIVNAGNLVVENGKAALDYNGTTTELTLPAINVSSPCSLFCALNMTGSSSSAPYVLNDYLGGAASETNYLLLGFINGSNTVRNFGDGANSGVDANYKDYSVYTSIIAGVNSVIARNGNTITLDSNATINKTGSIISIGAAKGRQGGTFVDGRMQIIAFYISDQSSNRTAIETVINNEYSIY